MLQDIITMQIQLSYLANVPYSDTNNTLYTEFLLMYQSFVDIKKREEEELRRQEQKQRAKVSQSQTKPVHGLSNLNLPTVGGGFGGV